MATGDCSVQEWWVVPHVRHHDVIVKDFVIMM